MVEIVEKHACASQITPMPGDCLASTIAALLDGIAIEELTEPGTVADEPVGQAIVWLPSLQPDH